MDKAKKIAMAVVPVALGVVIGMFTYDFIKSKQLEVRTDSSKATQVSE